MKFWRTRKKTTISPGRSLGLEQLEDRAMLATLSLVSGQVTSFHDADGSQVSVKLVGPGQGTLELVGGVTTGAAIDSLSLTGTTGESKLKVSTRGGTVKGTTINELAINKALNEQAALKHLKAKKLYFNDGGSFTADGDVAKIHVRALGDDVTFDVDGDVDRFKTYWLGQDTSVDVSGTLQKFVAQLLEAGSEVSAEQLDMLKIKQQAVGASVEVGDGGLARAKINNLYNSSIASQGDVGKIVVRGDIMNSALASNIDNGSDGIFGTIDDFVIDAAAAGNIAMVKLKGAVGAAGTNQEVSIVTSGSVGTMKLGPQASAANEPFVWEEAASQFVPLSIVQATAEATGFADDEVWIAVFGEQIVTPGPGVVPPQSQGYYLDANQLNQGVPKLQAAKNLTAGDGTPNLPILPSFTIAEWAQGATNAWGSNLSFPGPAPNHQFTGRIVISVGAPVQAQVSPGGLVSAPSASDLTDPSTGTFYDFLEFTVSNPNTSSGGTLPISIDVDTSQVDSFGIPIELQFFQDAAGTIPINYTFTGVTTTGSKTITGLDNTTGLGQGQPVFGTGIPAGATIQSIVNPTKNKDGSNKSDGSITLNLEATATSPSLGESLTAYAAGPVGVKAERETILSGSTNDALLQFLSTQIADGNLNARPFLQSAASYPKSAAVAITDASASGTITISTASTAGLTEGDVVVISGVEDNTAANGAFTVTNIVPNTSFDLVDSAGNGTYTGGGTWTAYTSGGRLVSPKDVVEALTSPQDTSVLNNYFNEVIDEFFLKHLPSTVTLPGGKTGGGEIFNLASGASGTSLTYSGTVTNSGTSTGGYVLRLKSSDTSDTTNYDIYYPFFTSNAPDTSVYTPDFPTAAAPSWIIAKGQQDESASQMVFGNDAVFADNTVRPASDMKKSYSSQVLGDLEDSIAAAFNRGIVLESPGTWGDTTTWFKQDNGQAGAYNYWVEYWHQTGLTFSDLAYAFPYDDKFGASTNLNQSDVGLAKVTLGSWGSNPATTTAFQSFPTSASLGTPVTLTAQVTGASPTGTVTFFINGAAINSTDDTAAPPLEAVAIDGSGVATITADLPALPDGTSTHTYTVTAVYSGDANNLPSIAYDSLKIAEPIDLTITPNGGVLGSTTQVEANLPGTDFTGTLTFSISHSDGTGSQTLGTVMPTSLTVTENYKIPENLLQFTGDTTSGSATITNVSSMVDLKVGQVISGAGIPTGSTIASLGASSITLGANATATGTGATLTSNGDGAEFLITADFVPTMGDSSAGTATLNVSADPYSLLLAPGSGTLGSTPTMTVTLPGPLYNGTVTYSISHSDGTGSQVMETVVVSDSTLTNGNTIVATPTIPANLLTFTGDVTSGSAVITNVSSFVDLVPSQQTITGTGIPANTKISTYTPAELTLSQAATSSSSTVTLTAGGMTFSGVTTSGNTQVVGILSLTGLNNGDTITGSGIPASTTITAMTPGSITLSSAATATNAGMTLTSDAVGTTYPITAIWTPTGGSPLTSAPQMFQVT
jgi:hypothetical protein